MEPDSSRQTGLETEFFRKSISFRRNSALATKTKLGFWHCKEEKPMKIKQILILLGVVIVLLVIVLVITREPKKTTEELFPSFKSDKIAKIEIKSEDKNTVLKKPNGDWLVETEENYRADQEAVKEIFDKVKEFKFKATDLASENPENQSKFHVDEESGIEVKLSDSSDNLLAHFFVGRSKDFLSAYVRKADANEVYRMKENLTYTLDRHRGWRDTTIFDFNSGDATKLTIESEGEKLVLQTDAEGKWELIEPEKAKAKKDAVDGILNKLSSLDTDDFAEKKELKEYSLDEPVSSVSAELNDGSSRILLIGKEEGGKHYVKRADKDTVFQIYKSSVNQLLKKVDDLKAEEKAEEEGEESEALLEEKK